VNTRTSCEEAEFALFTPRFRELDVLSCNIKVFGRCISASATARHCNTMLQHEHTSFCVCSTRSLNCNSLTSTTGGPTLCRTYQRVVEDFTSFITFILTLKITPFKVVLKPWLSNTATTHCTKGYTAVQQCSATYISSVCCYRAMLRVVAEVASVFTPSTAIKHEKGTCKNSACVGKNKRNTG